MAEKKWTPQQLDAINAESGTLLVSAAAGSGKTSVLVERIVRKLTSEEDPCPPDSLLVVTFTNAAAAEMRSRIYKRLGEKMAESPEEYRRLSGLRARLDEMQVCTMDSFCIRLVREHFSACDTDPDFTILDKGPEDVLKAQAVSETIEYLYENDAEHFAPLARVFETGRADRNLSAGIIQLSDFSMSEPDPEAWLNGVADNFAPVPARHSVWGEALCSYFADGLSYALSLCDKMAEELSFCGSLPDKYSDMLKSDKLALTAAVKTLENGEWDDIIEALSAAQRLMSAYRFSADKGYTNEIHRECAKESRAKIKDIIKDLTSLIPASEEENSEDTKALFPVALELIKAVNMFNMSLMRKKKDQNAYSFSDITHFALKLLYSPSAPDGKTELARSLSANIREILIDEYQDTNHAQDTLFTCLSSGGDNMFMVGDVKQSIYRFRLASPEIFIEKSAAYPHYDGKAKRSKIILSSNFRSRKGVTDAVNYMFSAIMSEKCGEIEYNGDEELHFGAEYYPGLDEPDAEIHLIKNTDLNEYETEADYIAELIADKTANGAEVFAGNGYRKAEYSDFCILLRSVKGIAPVYAAALRARGIPAAPDSREGFFETAEVRMAMSLLHAADDPSRDVDLLAVMLSPAFGFTPDDAAKIKITAKNTFKNKKYSLYNALKLVSEQNGGKFALLADTLTVWRKMAACENAARTVRRIYDDTALLSIAGSMTEGSLRRANLRTLLLAAEKFSSSGAAGLSSFVRYLDMLKENGADIGRSASAGQSEGVRIMTMHHSKGLEFPFVIIAGLTKASGGDRRSELTVSHKLGIGLKRREPENLKLYETLSSRGVDRAMTDADISEELRVYYVAMTRAKEKLYIVAAPKKCEEKLAEMQYTDLKERCLPVYAVKKCSEAWQWFAKVFARHPDASVLRMSNAYTAAAQSPVKAVLAEPVNALCTPSPEAASADGELVAGLLSGMDFSYKYSPIACAASKHTASNLSAEKFSPAFFGQSVPGFMFSSSLTPAERGTATHLFLQYCDFTVCETDAESEKQRLIKTGRLTPEQGEGVDMRSVSDFFRSDVYARIKRADTVIRERQFTVAESVCALDSSVPEEFADEKTVVIGKTDLIFTENGKAVIVDYKTDNVDDINVLRSRYAGQMKMYISAVKKSLGLEVKECILYSIKLRASIIV